ncbi:MAG: RDD family protein [Halobacteriovoraceae bacterium]|nr:RDD family protein [Halobacteriovoraceae bacterium]
MAHVIDISMIFGCYIGIIASFVSFLSQFDKHFLITPKLQYQNQFTAFIFLIFPICFVCYFTLNYYMSDGLTLGKLLMKIRMHSKKEKSLSLSLCFLRASFQLMSYFTCSLPHFLSFVREDRLSLTDLFCQTYHEYLIEESETETLKSDNVVFLPYYPLEASKEIVSKLEEENKKAS